MQVKISSEVGERLSNTSIICPMVWDNLGKLRVILDMRLILEGSFFERLRHRMSRRLIRLLVR